MGKQGLSTKTIVAIGIGTAVFVILGRFVTLPSGVPNTNIDTAYAFLALMGVLFGPLAGFLIGLLGHALKDAVFFGSIWWSWVICSGLVGLFFGLAGLRLKVRVGEFTTRGIILFNVVQIIGQLLAWFVIAPLLDILIYAEPANKVFLQGAVAGTANIVTVGVLGTLLIAAYAKTRNRSGSLQKE
ncbi:energy-coupling factor transport system substrate-specific component [Aureibacillus halotolerans]|uniref:UPF0397 protein EV213_10140 n=1 Tax=Aureibacillus halotolerans TaxID=1508390 RepID=A0A4R6U9W4_9BACI|nr:energy-coupling factor transport system substrate-specific component [Aureibacillus halotolerans]